MENRALLIHARALCLYSSLVATCLHHWTYGILLALGASSSSYITLIGPFAPTSPPSYQYVPIESEDAVICWLPETFGAFHVVPSRVGVIGCVPDSITELTGDDDVLGLASPRSVPADLGPRCPRC